jgi:hypothetical protein
MTICNFLYSFLASLLAICFIYFLYFVSAIYVKGKVAKGKCWWLPKAKTFRFVIRNLYGKGNLYDIKYHVWLRKDIPPSEGISITTLDDFDVCEGNRIILPAGQDLPIICFRLQNKKSFLYLVVTNKMGKPISTFLINDDSFRIMIEFSVRIRTFFFFKQEISRLYSIPQFKTIEGVQRNVFLDILLPMQGSKEKFMKMISQYAEEITVTV